MRDAPRPLPWPRLAGLLALALCLAFADTPPAGAKPGRDETARPVLIYDYPPGQALPIHFRLADGGPKGDPGKTPAQAAADERARLRRLSDTATAAVTVILAKNARGGIGESERLAVGVTDVVDEAKLAADRGLSSLRLYVPDHMAPDTWLHVHWPRRGRAHHDLHGALHPAQ